MGYRLTAADVSAPTRVGDSAWRRSQFAEELGTCFTDHLTLDDGLAVVYAHYLPEHDLLETSVIEREARALTVTVALEGRSSILGCDGQRFDFVAGHSTISAFGRLRGERRFPAKQSIRQLRLIVEEPLLHRYGMGALLDGVKDDQSAHRLLVGKHGGVIRKLSDTLVHLHDHAGSHLDLQIAALSLLSEQTKPITPRLAETAKIRTEDRDKMLQARDILNDQFDRPLTVPYLCAAVGINEFKLKQGFRELFGTSPHRMLTDIRMQKAWELLETGIHVSTVAYKVGFQHLSSFSAAFHRYYGRQPKSVAGSTNRSEE